MVLNNPHSTTPKRRAERTFRPQSSSNLEVQGVSTGPATPSERKFSIPSLQKKIQYVRGEAVMRAPIEHIDTTPPFETERLLTASFTPRDMGVRRPKSSERGGNLWKSKGAWEPRASLRPKPQWFKFKTHLELNTCFVAICACTRLASILALVSRWGWGVRWAAISSSVTQPRTFTYLYKGAFLGA